MRIGNQKDFWSGVMFIVLGLAFAGFAQEYDMGTAQRMGPAFFPTVLGGLLAVIGVVVGIAALGTEVAEGRIDTFHFGPLLIVLGAVTLFGMMLRPLGLVVALSVMVGIAAYASHEFRVREAIPLIVFLVLLVLAVFIWGLGLVIPVWPAFLTR